MNRDMNRNLNHNKGAAQGYSLMEALLAIALISLMGTILATGLVQYRKIVGRSQMNHSVDQELSDIVENIRPNLSLYQINFNATAQARETALNQRDLPMAWAPGQITTAAACPGCPGRFGFVIQPFPDQTGLYVLTLRMTNTEWHEPYRDYSFLVTTK
jgi:cytoskeletal protein RodZ